MFDKAVSDMDDRQQVNQYHGQAIGIALAVLIAATSADLPRAAAQYPKVSKAISHETQAKTAAMLAHSEEAWQKALPIIKEWEQKGKPYIPWAAKPSDLPQAPIPAFPGAEGGGMYTFGGRGGRVLVAVFTRSSTTISNRVH
ncbi:MAG: hypothetical protein KDA60_07640 [Planctomycetales bacterium]|nr:hypothetical protein [Planctomycetales bacterium]